jgi:hypothetical protein
MQGLKRGCIRHDEAWIVDEVDEDVPIVMNAFGMLARPAASIRGPSNRSTTWIGWPCSSMPRRPGGDDQRGPLDLAPARELVPGDEQSLRNAVGALRAQPGQVSRTSGFAKRSMSVRLSSARFTPGTGASVGVASRSLIGYARHANLGAQEVTGVKGHRHRSDERGRSLPAPVWSNF